MSLEFIIDDGWSDSNSGPDEERRTMAWLKIVVGKKVATRVEDIASRSVRSRILVPAYPLATWLAASWWRLRSESSPVDTPSTDWRMSHEMTAVGRGCLWPRLLFAFDGERMIITCRGGVSMPSEPIQYLEQFQDSVSAEAFEAAVDDFVDLVLSRLDAVGIGNTALHGLWQELNDERKNAESAAYRRVEASLGHDPDDAPIELVNRFLGLSGRIGDDAATEIAAFCSERDPDQALTQIEAHSSTPGIAAKFEPPPDLLRLNVSRNTSFAAPWKRGSMTARHARAHWALGDEEISDQKLADLLNISPTTFESTAASATPDLGLAVRDKADSREYKLLFRRRNRPGRRFEAARLLADSLFASTNDLWLPATDSKTARQKFQRSFATEFLCPIDLLTEYLGDDISDANLEESADHFGISPLAVRSHLANARVLPIEYWQDH